MKPIVYFNHALGRSRHLLELYDLLHDVRRRDVRRDWADEFRRIMHWPNREDFIRIDGKDRDSILIIKSSKGITRDKFQHEYVSEILRSSIVTAVSAMDRYFHDIIMDKSMKLMNRKDDEIPKEVKKINIPLLSVKKALKRLKDNSSSRPGHIIKKSIQEFLHGQHTFQGAGQIEKGFKMLGVDDCWGRMETRMGKPRKEIIDTLNIISDRRNKIVHEADFIRKTKGRQISLRVISRSDTEVYVQFIQDFIGHADTEINS